jgi:hypothetical protein
VERTRVRVPFAKRVRKDSGTQNPSLSLIFEMLSAKAHALAFTALALRASQSEELR